VTTGGEAHVLANDNGEAIRFRHAWQIRDRLRDQFQIAVDRLRVETIRD
jgi:hypothetical protein